MRHQKRGKKFNRSTNQRKALFKNLLSSLFLHEEIKTTLVKAKLVKRMADGLVSRAKKGSLSVRRQILAFLSNKKVTNKLVDEIAPRFDDRTGGFTRLERLGQRRGDNVMMAKVELLEKKPRKDFLTGFHRPIRPRLPAGKAGSPSGNQRGKE